MNCLTDQELELYSPQDATLSKDVLEHLQSCENYEARLKEIQDNLGFETDLHRMGEQDDGVEMKPKTTASKPGSTDTLVPEFGGNRYESANMIGKGGMGAVYLTRDRNLRRDVAMKTMLNASKSSSPREISKLPQRN